MTEPAQSILFVVDGKTLEAMSLVLVASIARHHDTKNAVRVVAYAPASAQLNPATLALYAACHVQVDPLPSAEGLWKRPYPHGNKLLAMAQPRPSQRSIFLDTDIVLQGPITDLAPASPDEVLAVPEGKPTWGKTGDAWERAYRFFGLQLPSRRVTLTRGRRRAFLPYFNAGFVAFSDQALDDQGRSFGQLWLDFARRFDWDCPVANKRPWLDQITLPLVMAFHDIPYQVLEEVYNFSTSERADLSALPQARVVHYHRATYFNALPNAAAHLQAVRALVPEALHPQLEVLLALYTQTPAWSPDPAAQGPAEDPDAEPWDESSDA